jgi:hypothetical protein
LRAQLGRGGAWFVEGNGGLRREATLTVLSGSKLALP